MDRRSWEQVAAVVVVLVLGAALSALHGIDTELPATSLGWALLLHIERAALLIGAIATVLLVGVRALNGRFPVRFGQIEYPVEQMESEVDHVQALHEQRLEMIEAMLGMYDGQAKQI